MAEEKKPITIKNALIDDKTYLDKLASNRNCSVAEALTVVVNTHKTCETLQETCENLRKQLTLETEKVNNLEAENAKLTSDLEAEKEKPPIEKTIEIEKEVIKEVEKIIEVERKLQGTEFLFIPDEKTATNMRKVRQFAKKEGFVETTEPSELLTVAMNQFMKKHFPHIID